ncbi:MAG: DUF6690 family protein [Pirellulales bacterium]
MLPGRNKLLAAALAAATGAPYLVSLTAEKGDKPAAVERSAGASSHADRADDPRHDGGSHHADSSSAMPIRQARVYSHDNMPIEGLPVRSLDEVLRFDINPSWIMSRWGRVFTTPTEDTLRGYRVALVTGTADYDLAGSLTYLFNTDQKLQRITFVGYTGNALPLATLAERKYNLQRQSTDDPGLQLYQLQRSGEAVSELRIEPATVVESGNLHGRYHVSLWLERPLEPNAMFSRDAGPYSDRLW